MANDTNRVIVELGTVIKNRNNYSNQARYFKDNVVQYEGGSYIAQPTSSVNDGVLDGKYYLTRAPFTTNPQTPNAGWSIFATGKHNFGSGEDIEDISIATNADFVNPDSTSRAKVPTVGTILDGMNDGVYDVSARNSGATFDSLNDLLSNTNLNTLIPSACRKGGMSIRFVQNSDNNSTQYVQYRYMGTSPANADFTNVANWQGVDDKPTAGSRNLTESGGISNKYNGNFQSILVDGKGVTISDYVSSRARDFISGRTYKLHVVEWDDAGYNHIGMRFEVSLYDGNTLTPIIQVPYTGSIQDSYTVEIPSGTEYVSIGGRINKESIGRVVVEDITYTKLNEKIDTRLMSVARMTGDGNTLVRSSFLTDFIPEHKYRCYIKSWDLTGVTSGSTYDEFTVASINGNDVKTLLVHIYMGTPLQSYYDFDVPSDTVKIQVSGRASTGTEAVCLFYDITYLQGFDTVEDVDKKLVGKVNYEVIDGNAADLSYGLLLSISGVPTYYPRVDYAITLFLPVQQGDVIEWHNGYDGGNTGPHIIMYDSNKDYLGYYSYTSSVDGVRTINLTNANVAFIRASVYLKNPQVPVPKIIKNGELVWEYKTPLVGLREKVDKKLLNNLEIPLLVHDWYDGYIRSNGTEATSSVNMISAYVNIEGYKYIRLLMNYSISTNTGAAAFYDKDGVFLSGTGVSPNSGSPVDGNYEERLLTIPSNATYIKTTFKKARKDEFYMYGILEEKNTDILFFNNDKEFLPKMQMAKKSSTKTGNTPFVCAYFSDMHMTDNRNLKRIIQFCNHNNQFIDIIINGGDTVRDKYEDGFDWYKDTQGAEKILMTIGNHDVASNVSDQISAGDAYTTYIAPFKDAWGVTFNENDANTCYYYRDKNNVRLIVLDFMNYTTTQNNWFVSVLNSAKTAGLHVVVAAHFTGLRVVGLPCRWTSVLEPDSQCGAELGLSNIEDAAAAINSFQSSGGIFVCWLVGHVHRNIVGKLESENFPNQLVVAANTSGIHTLDSDTQHVLGTRSQDDFNIVSIDTTGKYIRVFKVGDDRDVFMRKIDSIVLSYDTHTLITN